MKKFAFSVAACALFASSAWAQDGDEVGGGLSFNVDVRPTLYGISFGEGFSLDDSAVDVGFGASLSHGRWGVQAYYRLPLYRASGAGDNQLMRDDLAGLDITNRTQRSTAGLALSYAINDNWNAYVGVRYGQFETEFLWEDPSVGTGRLDFYDTINLETFGPTVGIGYASEVSENSMVTFSAGIGILVGEARFNQYFVPGNVQWRDAGVPPTQDLQAFNNTPAINNDIWSIGSTATASYLYFLDDHWTIDFGIDGYYYDYGRVQAFDSAFQSFYFTGPNAANGEVDIREWAVSGRVTLSYAF